MKWRGRLGINRILGMSGLGRKAACPLFESQMALVDVGWRLGLSQKGWYFGNTKGHSRSLSYADRHSW